MKFVQFKLATFLGFSLLLAISVAIASKIFQHKPRYINSNEVLVIGDYALDVFGPYLVEVPNQELSLCFMAVRKLEDEIAEHVPFVLIFKRSEDIQLKFSIKSEYERVILLCRTMGENCQLVDDEILFVYTYSLKMFDEDPPLFDEHLLSIENDGDVGTFYFEAGRVFVVDLTATRSPRVQQFKMNSPFPNPKIVEDEDTFLNRSIKWIRRHQSDIDDTRPLPLSVLHSLTSAPRSKSGYLCSSNLMIEPGFSSEEASER